MRFRFVAVVDVERAGPEISWPVIKNGCRFINIPRVSIKKMDGKDRTESFDQRSVCVCVCVWGGVRVSTDRPKSPGLVP